MPKLKNVNNVKIDNTYIPDQMARRNLTKYARCELAYKLKPIIAKEAEKREKAGKELDDPSALMRLGKTASILAKLATVSTRTNVNNINIYDAYIENIFLSKPLRYLTEKLRFNLINHLR